jgi:hypothetical protein
MIITRMLFAVLLLAVAGCASSRGGRVAAEPAGGSEQIESGQVNVGHGESGIVNYEDVLSDPGPF